MNPELLNIVRREVERALRDRGVTLHGTICAYDPATYRAKVKLQPDGVISNWMPIGSMWVGNGWGIVAPPQNSTQVQVVFQEEDKDSGVITQNLYDDINAPPVGSPQVAQGECLLFHSSGSYIKLANTGNLILNSAVEIEAGSVGNALHKLLMDTFIDFMNSHTHGGVTTGSDSTDVPDQTLDSSYFTDILMAN